ncbi:hypothetical protein KY285_016364 [Solanum tuberosum]|nr:hypothetical protein KY284_016359 [Solanum tuberosum]KAH0702086.1 hypothetical protein KY285_016364 [Solanum tuberosum]
MKNLKKALCKWSRETYGDIFKELIVREEVVKVKEQLFEGDASIINLIVLQEAQVEVKKYLAIEELYWKQKAGISWFVEGDRNTSFFHNYVNGKRKKLQIHWIQDENGNWVESVETITDEAISFFQKQFTQADDQLDLDILKHISPMVSQEHNCNLCSYPGKEEVKQAVFALSGESTSGPDGFTIH